MHLNAWRSSGIAASRYQGTVRVILSFLAGLLIFAAVASVGNVSGKVMVLVLAGAVFVAGAFLAGYPREIFLFGWVFSLTYNRQFFLFEWLVGKHASQGPYLLIADLFLAGLFLIWLYEVIVLRQRREPLGGSLWYWYLPFVLACILSGVSAERLDWTVFELIRVAKVGLLLFYLRYNLSRREWWVCLIAIGLAFAAQSVLGTLEVVFKKSGVLWIFGLGVNETDVPDAFHPEKFYGMYRATGTMSHPPNLACYLLLTVPVFISLGLTTWRKGYRIIFGLIGLSGLVGLAFTQSRWPLMLSALQIVVIIVGLVILREIPLKRAIAVFALGAFALLLTAGLLHERISERMSRDFRESVEQRMKGIRTALNMLNDGNRLTGVGLNNYRVHILDYEPDLIWIRDNEDLTVRFHTRFIAAPENGFLFVLAETGIIGLGAFLFYLFGIFRISLRAVFSSGGTIRAACMGLMIGLVGVLAQQAIDYSYWVDPVLFTFTLIVAMLNNAQALAGTSPGVVEIIEA